MFVVEMHRVPRPMAGYDNFHCPGGLWAELFPLARAFGWLPKGALVPDGVRPGQRDVSYDPGIYGAPLPIVEADDANAWAKALRQACCDLESHGIDLPHRGPLVLNLWDHVELNTLANGGLTRAFLREVIAYFERGAFDFAWDD